MIGLNKEIPMEKIDLKGLWIKELEKLFGELGEQNYRARQLAKWIYNKGVNNFEVMTDLPLELRKKLSEISFISKIKLVKKKVSSLDGTEKFLFELADGKKIETVLMREKERITVCISTQAGCPLNCKFCATGKSGFERNLSAGEIIDQIIAVKEHLKNEEKITNIVIMGMGEPLLNYNNTIKAIEIMQSQFGFSIPPRKITLSTAGITDAIYKLSDEGLKVKLSISLNSADDRIRTEIMPVNKKYPLSGLFESLRYFSKKNPNPVTFEYVMIKGINDSKEDAKKLVRVITGFPFKINLIPYNPVENCPYEKSDDETMNQFREICLRATPAVTIRKSKGVDIEGACGQLKAKG